MYLQPAIGTGTILCVTAEPIRKSVCTVAVLPCGRQILVNATELSGDPWMYKSPEAIVGTLTYTLFQTLPRSIALVRVTPEASVIVKGTPAPCPIVISLVSEYG